MGFMTMAKDGAASIAAMVGSATGKQSTLVMKGLIAKAVATSTKRKESLLMYVGLASMMPPNQAAALPLRAVTIGMGKAASGRALVVRISARK